MDVLIKKKKWTTQRIVSLAMGALVVVLVGASYFSTSGKAKLNVDTNKITISSVTKGNFQEFIPLDGIVLPIKTIYLDATEGGTVQKILVEDGATLKQGTPIVQLSNTDLQLEMMNRETAVFDLINNMNTTRNLMQQNRITQLNQLADIDYNLRDAERLYVMNKKLYEEKVVPQQEFLQAKYKYDYQVRKRQLTLRTLRQDSLNMSQQLAQMKESVERMQNNLALMRKKMDDLMVKAPVDGQITSLNAEIGESKTRGQRLGQIDVLDGFKVRANIDEHYISRVFTGQKATFSFAGKDYDLNVKKVFTQVTNGQFQVDMEFMNEVPKGIRRGQSLQLRLALSDQTQAVLVPRGGFYQKTGGNWIFKIDENGNKAYRTEIRLGRQNPEYFEVVSGLNPGDKVVTSSYENYEDMGELVINEEKE
ncbi:efflux RND transporter periplasmic adaptor subunit [Adhaeribacter radiodurans]|uniref:Efflux RND transporter periplasmic adaptor subunit n=1 Tax=Adhaeribacter radiodurans TaxID=2745197 RepID=A0A7L7LEV3_9BACT|nr:efflux RND transporter periplasmic adaptor subunit [Adhaeribacter radiodurans]QMU31378.1 efflux RND transporter periplasmic adaptor subunit [Adhaeribacter radiodurans]